MPSVVCGIKDWRKVSEQREAYRQRLIAKGIVDGGSKMRELMYRKFH